MKPTAARPQVKIRRGVHQPVVADCKGPGVDAESEAIDFMASFLSFLR
jgi:hypothetical protein